MELITVNAMDTRQSHGTLQGTRAKVSANSQYSFPYQAADRLLALIMLSSKKHIMHMYSRLQLFSPRVIHR